MRTLGCGFERAYKEKQRRQNRVQLQEGHIQPMTSLKLASYVEQKEFWPKTGRHILAQFDETSIVVYQAFNPVIAQYAVVHSTFAGCPVFSMTRMTWIKTNFLWMMYRCGWATKDDNQKRVLAIRIPCRTFEAILSRACVTSHHSAADAADSDAWRAQLAKSDVRLQWDPDHSPTGGKLERRAIQLGLKGGALELYLDSILHVEDITDSLVSPQADAALSGNVQELQTPLEGIYLPTDVALQAHIGLSSSSTGATLSE